MISKQSVPPTIYTNSQKWLVAFGIAALTGVASVWYTLHTLPQSTWLEYLSFSAASIASLLFATALSMGSISYFTGWPNLRHGFQKQIGVSAFWWALFYTTTLIMLYPETYWLGLPHTIYTADVLLGGSAMIIFAAMVLINSPFVKPFVARSTIFFVLGLGYVGYALLVMRAVLLEFELWQEWFITLAGLPPGRLVLSIIAVGVLLLRLLVAIHKHIHHR